MLVLFDVLFRIFCVFVVFVSTAFEAQIPQKSRKETQSTVTESTFYRARYREVVTEHKLRIVNLLHNTNCVLAPLTNDVQRDVV